MKQLFKKLFPGLLSLCVLLSLMSVSPAALASSETGETEAAETEQTAEATPKVELSPIGRLTVTLSRGPVVLTEVDEIEGDVSSRHASFVSLTWYDKSGNQVTGAFELKDYRMEIRAKADEGYYFPSDVPAYLNNSSAAVSVDSDGQYATVTKEYTAVVWAPTVIKHPWGETVNEGSYATFNASATHTVSTSWELTDGTTTIKMEDINKTFPDVIATIGETKVTLDNIPAEMDGWAVRAVFHGAADVITRSKTAEIKVNASSATAATPAPTEEPAVEETPVPEETEGETSVEEGTEIETQEPTETEPAQQSYAIEWSYDDQTHWHASENGTEKSELARHSMTWQRTKAPTRAEPGEEVGLCDVCGYTVSYELPYRGNSPLQQLPFEQTVGGMLALIAILVVLQSIIHAVKTRKKNNQAEDDD